MDHDTQILSRADWIIELGPEAGAKGGRVIAQGRVADVIQNPQSRMAPYLSAEAAAFAGPAKAAAKQLFDFGEIRMSTEQIHTVKPLAVRFPKGRLSVVTGVSGSGKTTLILESLIPALEAAASGKALPAHIRSAEAAGIRQIKLIDATPIGINVRSTVATYANVHDELRKVYAKTPDAERKRARAGRPTIRGICAARLCDGDGNDQP